MNKLKCFYVLCNKIWSFVAYFAVAPYVGAWIEIWDYSNSINVKKVAPYVGAWIEMIRNCWEKTRWHVAPYVGAWIEIAIVIIFYHPLSSRTLCGCVDWNNRYLRWRIRTNKVAPYVGAWIEIVKRSSLAMTSIVAPYVGAWIEMQEIPCC